MDCQESYKLVSSVLFSSPAWWHRQSLRKHPVFAMHGDKLHIAFCFKCYKSLAIIYSQLYYSLLLQRWKEGWNMHRARAPFQKADVWQCMTGDEWTSHHVSGVIKSCEAGISWVRTKWTVWGPRHVWQNEWNTWRGRGVGVNKHTFSIFCMMRIHLLSPGVTNKRLDVLFQIHLTGFCFIFHWDRVCRECGIGVPGVPTE